MSEINKDNYLHKLFIDDVSGSVDRNCVNTEHDQRIDGEKFFDDPVQFNSEITAKKATFNDKVQFNSEITAKKATFNDKVQFNSRIHTKDVYVGGYFDENGKWQDSEDTSSSFTASGTVKLTGEVDAENASFHTHHMNVGGELKVAGDARFNHEVRISNSLRVDKEVQANGAKLTASLDMKENDIKNVKSLKILGTLDTYNDIKMKPNTGREDRVKLSDALNEALGHTFKNRIQIDGNDITATGASDFQEQFNAALSLIETTSASVIDLKDGGTYYWTEPIVLTKSVTFKGSKKDRAKLIFRLDEAAEGAECILFKAFKSDVAAPDITITFDNVELWIESELSNLTVKPVISEVGGSLTQQIPTWGLNLNNCTINGHLTRHWVVDNCNLSITNSMLPRDKFVGKASSFWYFNNNVGRSMPDFTEFSCSGYSQLDLFRGDVFVNGARVLTENDVSNVGGARVLTENDLPHIISIVKYVTNGDTVPGLYRDGKLVTFWDMLVADGAIAISDDVIVASDAEVLVGDLVVPEGIVGIGDSAFEKCIGLKSVAIPSTVTHIGYEAFYLSGLETATIPSNVTSFGTDCFYECPSLKSVTIEEGVTCIPNNMFYGCTSLCYIVIPDSVTSIGSDAFASCEGLTEITIPGSVESMGSGVFDSCNALKDVVLGEGVTSIGSASFQSCTSLVNITIPNSVVSIDDYAFNDCGSLATITIPASVTELIGYPFGEGCDNLTNIVYTGTVEQWNAITKEENWHVDVPATYVQCSDGTVCLKHTYENGVCVNCGAAQEAGLYADGVMTKSWDELVTEGAVTVTDGAAKKGSNSGLLVGELIISNSVTSIADYSFGGCSGLTSVEIPDSVTYIGINAFYGCSNLTSVVINGSGTTIGSKAFGVCTKLANVVINGTSIGSEAFYACRALASVEIGSDVTSIGIRAFSDCSRLVSITFEGAMEQWNAITKGYNWNTNVPATYVQCSDGQVVL